MGRHYNQYHGHSIVFRISPAVNATDGIDFAMLFTLKTTWKAGGLQILSRRRRDQGIATASSLTPGL
jgi:hypothetical protein